MSKFQRAALCVGWALAALMLSQPSGAQERSVSPSLDIHGFVDLYYQRYEEQAGGETNSLPGGNNVSFDNYHFNIFVNSDVRSDLSIAGEWEFEHGGEEIDVHRAYIEWRPSPYANLTFGRFYAPFGIEQYSWTSLANKLGTRPLPSRFVVPGTWTETGVQLSGEFSPINYKVAVANGLGETLGNVVTPNVRDARQFRDNNESSALVGRVGLPIANRFEVGASFAGGAYDALEDFGYRYYGVDLSWEKADLQVHAEYVTSDVETTAGSLGRSGYYSQAAYKVIEPGPGRYLEVVGRYDTIDTEFAADIPRDLDRTALGLNFRMNSSFLIKTEYDWVKEPGVKLENNGFTFVAVAAF